MINWRRPRVIGIIVAILVVLATGGAAEIASVQEAGSAVAVSQRYAAVGKVADGSTAPGSTTGNAGSGNDRSACPPDDRQPTSSQRPGATKELVPAGATSLTICRYRGVNTTAGQAAFQLIGTGAIEDSGTTGEIAQALNAIKPTRGTLAPSCPADDGSAMIATFSYRSGVSSPVRIGTRGCEGVTNGHIQRLAMEASVVGELEGFVRPVKTRVATFSGHVLGCGGIAPGSCHIIRPRICTPKCHRATRVVAYSAQDGYLGEGQLRRSHFRFNVAAAGPYTLKLESVNQVIARVTVNAQLGQITPVVFTMQLK